MPTIFNSNINISSSVQIFLRTLRNKNLSIHVESTATVYELKDFIERKYGVPVETQQLFHQGRLLKDKRSLSTYKLNAKSTMSQPILLTQSFTVQVFISSKVSSLYSLTANNNMKKNKNKNTSKVNKKKKMCDNNYKELPSQQTIQCSSTTTIHSVLKQLNLCHLTHLLKVCVGAETEDIKNMRQKLIDIPHILSDGIVSILFSARWFLDRTVEITTFNSKMSQTIQKTINSSKLLKSCASFNRLDYQFEKTQSFILSQFDELEMILNNNVYEIKKADKWCNNITQNNAHRKLDKHAQKLLNQLQSKIEDINNALILSQKKWNKKRTQIVSYLQDRVRRTETELMVSFKTWNTNDVIQWLQYMDSRIILSNVTIQQFEIADICGQNLSNINDLSLKLMGINDIDIRQLIVGYINALLLKFDSDVLETYPSDDIMNNHENSHEKTVCCICVKNEVKTVIVPCGHAVYCSECSKTSLKHCNRCPICRQKVSSIINVYNAGFHCQQMTN